MLKVIKFKTTIVLQEDGETIHCTRMINSRIALVVTKCGPTIIEFGEQVNKMSKLDDELFELFDRIRKSEEAIEPL